MAATTADAWRNFPRYMLAAMAVVVAVNARFIYLALDTFPGAATTNDFDTSNSYNQILAAAEAQARLGWQEEAAAPSGLPRVTLSAHGAPLKDAVLTGTAERPLGAMAPITLRFTQTAEGSFTADRALPRRGQWDLRLRIVAQGQEARVTRRVVAP